MGLLREVGEGKYGVCGSARHYGYWCWLGMRRVVMVCYLKFNVVKAENMSVQELYFEKLKANNLKREIKMKGVEIYETN